MNSLVLSFFLGNVLATLLLGVKFVKGNDSALKSFGLGLLLDAIAFAAWAFAILQPADLLPSVTFGAVCFLISLVFMLNASVKSASAPVRMFTTLIGAIAVLGIFLVGHADPSQASVSPEGFLFFNLSPLVQMLYIFGLALASIPAIHVIASKFQGGYAALVRYGFIAEVAAGIVLITSNNSQVLYLTGWIIGIVYFVLWATLLFSRGAWKGVN